MSHVSEFMQMLAKEGCAATAWHEEKTLEEKCLDPEYSEYSQAMLRCFSCSARRALALDAAEAARN